MRSDNAILLLYAKLQKKLIKFAQNTTSQNNNLMSEIKRNLVYSTILTSAHYVFPLIVYPYVSRILGVDNIGLVSFVDSIATYFILFSMMGISVLGVREIAKSTGDKMRMNGVFSSLLALNGLLTLLAVIAMIFATFFVDELRESWQLMGVGLCKLIFNMFLIEWFYQGLEDFRYITLRSLAIRGSYVVAVFLFVKDGDDTLIYYTLTMLVVVVTAIVNMMHSRKYVNICSPIKEMGRLVRPFFTLGVFNLLSTAYTTLNIAYLGFVSTDTEVGYYATAMKLVAILMSLFSAVTGVLLPRMSSLAEAGDLFRFREYLNKSAWAMVVMSVPMIILVEIFASEIVMLLAGAGYEGAIIPVRIMIPFMLFACLANVFTIQSLVPLGLDREMNKITIIGAAIGILLNIAIVGRWGAVGSAIVWGLSEFVIFVMACRYMSKIEKPTCDKNKVVN